MLHSLKTGFTRLNTAVGLLCGFSLLLTGLLLFAEVVCRFLGSPTDWIAETSVYLFAGAMLLGGSYTLMRERHVRVELLLDCLSPRVQDICYFVSALGGMAFCALVVAHGWTDFLDVIETGETTATTLRIPLWITEMPLTIGFSLTAAQFFILACRRIVRLRQGSPLEGLKPAGGR
ncbi:hypothetical protein FACS1894206_04110 [Deltaproteobacteria bacterium]|nr:hypothetical protein FACS1894206_04110 [Deltaproteobacteria bacterium]